MHRRTGGFYKRFRSKVNHDKLDKDSEHLLYLSSEDDEEIVFREELINQEEQNVDKPEKKLIHKRDGRILDLYTRIKANANLRGLVRIKQNRLFKRDKMISLDLIEDRKKSLNYSQVEAKVQTNLKHQNQSYSTSENDEMNQMYSIRMHLSRNRNFESFHNTNPKIFILQNKENELPLRQKPLTKNGAQLVMRRFKPLEVAINLVIKDLQFIKDFIEQVFK